MGKSGLFYQETVRFPFFSLQLFHLSLIKSSSDTREQTHLSDRDQGKKNVPGLASQEEGTSGRGGHVRSRTRWQIIN